MSSAARHIDFHSSRRIYVAFIAHSIALSLLSYIVLQVHSVQGERGVPSPAPVRVERRRRGAAPRVRAARPKAGPPSAPRSRSERRARRRTRSARRSARSRATRSRSTRSTAAHARSRATTAQVPVPRALRARRARRAAPTLRWATRRRLSRKELWTRRGLRLQQLLEQLQWRCPYRLQYKYIYITRRPLILFVFMVKDGHTDSLTQLCCVLTIVQYFVTQYWFYCSQRSRNSVRVLMLIVLPKPAPPLPNLGNAKRVRKYRAKVGT